MTSSTAATSAYLERIAAAYPALALDQAQIERSGGQFNDILFVNRQLVFRFPRAPFTVAGMASEVALLEWLAPRLPLPIPAPTYRGVDPHTGALAFMGYALIPGEPLEHARLAALRDETALDHMAQQLAHFMRTLHTLPLAELDFEPPHWGGQTTWADLHARFQQQLYPFMRPAAQAQVTQLFDELLEDLRRNPFTPALRHGDFGGSNILYNPHTLSISGILDFEFCALGDPVLDIAALSTCGEDFVARGFAVYPEMEQMLPRARLYRGTYALIQALYGLRDGSQADFEDGIAAYI